jgi:hypothetical protein
MNTNYPGMFLCRCNYLQERKLLRERCAFSNDGLFSRSSFEISREKNSFSAQQRINPLAAFAKKNKKTG